MWGASTLLLRLLSGGVGGRSSELLQSLFSVLLLIGYCLPFVVNIGLLVFFAFTRCWIALGMLSAIGALIALAVCASVVFLVYCFTGGFNFGLP
jgi:hypothetical protein